MSRLIKKIIDYAPIPRVRYSTFCGTNSISEWLLALRAFLFGPREIPSTTQRYESEFAKIAGCKHAFSFALGRHALYASLKALGIGDGDEIILPAFTCVVVPNAILYCNATPVYVDIELDTFNISAELIEKKISLKTKAIYAQHTFGNICDMEKIKELAERYNLYIIEDAAHAMGFSYQNSLVGSLGDVAFFSTDHSKVISTVLGGMVTTNNSELAGKIESIYKATPFLSPQITKKLLLQFLFEFIFFSPLLFWAGKLLNQLLRKTQLFFHFDDELKVNYQEVSNYPARLPSELAQIGTSQLENIKKNLDHRKAVWLWLHNSLNYNNAVPKSTFLRYSFLVEDRNKFENYFLFKFELGTWFTSIAQERVKNFGEIKYREGSCPKAEYAAKHIVNFPTHLRIPRQLLMQRDITFAKTKILKPQAINI